MATIPTSTILTNLPITLPFNTTSTLTITPIHPMVGGTIQGSIHYEVAIDGDLLATLRTADAAGAFVDALTN